MDFYTFYISQGSVATQLRCGGVFSNHCITNFPQNTPVKKFWKSVNIWQRHGQNFAAYFWCHPVWAYAQIFHVFSGESGFGESGLLNPAKLHKESLLAWCCGRYGNDVCWVSTTSCISSCDIDAVSHVLRTDRRTWRWQLNHVFSSLMLIMRDHVAKILRTNGFAR